MGTGLGGLCSPDYPDKVFLPTKPIEVNDDHCVDVDEDYPDKVFLPTKPIEV